PPQPVQRPRLTTGATLPPPQPVQRPRLTTGATLPPPQPVQRPRLTTGAPLPPPQPAQPPRLTTGPTLPPPQPVQRPRLTTGATLPPPQPVQRPSGSAAPVSPQRPDRSSGGETLDRHADAGGSGLRQLRAGLDQQQLDVADPPFGEASLAVGEIQRPEAHEGVVVAKLGERAHVGRHALAPVAQSRRIVAGGVGEGGALEVGAGGGGAGEAIDGRQRAAGEDALVDERAGGLLDLVQAVVGCYRLGEHR